MYSFKMDPKLKSWLESNHITYILHLHPPVFTVPEAQLHCAHIPGRHMKNMFIRDSITQDYFLVTIPSEKRLAMKKFRKQIKMKKIRFCSADDLRIYLGLTPGAVSPLGLVNNHDKNVNFIVAKELWEADKVVMHPNINNESLELSQLAFHSIIEATQNPYQVLTIPYDDEKSHE